MKFKKRKWLKRYFDLNTELSSKVENNFQEKNCQTRISTLPGNFVEDVKKQRMVIARTAE